MNQTTDLVVRETIPALVGCYKLAVKEIEEAYALLEAARNRLRAAFLDGPGYRFDTNERNCNDVGKEASDYIINKIKRDAWGVLVERIELRRLLSIKGRDKLDEQMRNGEDLPDITEENIIAMLQSTVANVDNFMEEAVKEIFDYLRPPASKYKANTEYELGKRVILSYMVEKSYVKGKFSVSHWHDKYLTALDNVFSVIDGKGTIKTYNGPLYDAIKNCEEGTGETDYFRFKCYMNGNLHIEFKRDDLVARLNAIAGGNRIKTGSR